MQSELIQDRIARASGAAARAIGAPADAYRPRGAFAPLARANRFLRLHVAFTGPEGGFKRPHAYADTLCHGILDSAYTRPGDYLVQAHAIWFIASQQQLLPVLCVRAERTVSLLRPTPKSAIGANPYGGLLRQASIPLMTDWPASVRDGRSGGGSGVGLPNDVVVPAWTVLLPAVPNVVLRPTDLFSDDLGRNGVVIGAEFSSLGWRLTVRPAAA